MNNNHGEIINKAGGHAQGTGMFSTLSRCIMHLLQSSLVLW